MRMLQKYRNKNLTLKVNVPNMDDQWELQTEQYPTTGKPGFKYFRTQLKQNAFAENLLFYDKSGELAGVFNFYPVSIPAPDGHWLATVENPDSRFLERAGNFYIIVDPTRQRKGIGKKLLTEAAKRWPLNFGQQNYTEAGASLVQDFLRKAKNVRSELF